MSSKRLFFVLVACTGLLAVLFAVGAYESNKMLHTQGDKLVEKKLEKNVLDRQQENLQKAKRDLLDLQELSTLTESIIPRDKDQARTIVEINNLAKDAGITLGSIEFPASELGAITGRGRNAAPQTDNTLTQLTPVSDIKGMYAMDITLSSHGEIPVPYSSLISFLENLEKNRRTAQVVNISIMPDDENPRLINFSITLSAYIKPE